MSTCPAPRPLTALLAVALTGLAPAAAQAETTDDAWRYEASIYLWLPSIGGDTSFPANSGGSSIDVSSEDVLDALKMAFMGTASAKKGQWGLWTDLVYADFGAKKSGSRDFTIGNAEIPADVNANLKYDIKTWVWTVAGTYELVKKPNYTLDVLGGVRYLDVSQTLDWSISGDISSLPPVSRDGSAEASSSLWDGIVGVKGVADLGNDHKWFIPYYLDVGTGQSDLTWQVNAGIGYRYNWGSLVATWRYLDYEMDSNEPIKSVNLNGPLFGATFQW
ncbi:MAG: hypothetical protein V2I51_13595 [Anderseniella sp.]|jgi:hypothetical protein|nr:hypothetical protein [Anderseniella sp.]